MCSMWVTVTIEMAKKKTQMWCEYTSFSIILYKVNSMWILNFLNGTRNNSKSSTIKPIKLQLSQKLKNVVHHHRGINIFVCGLVWSLSYEIGKKKQKPTTLEHQLSFNAQKRNWYRRHGLDQPRNNTFPKRPLHIYPTFLSFETCELTE